jgi:hypothetical protein
MSGRKDSSVVLSRSKMFALNAAMDAIERAAGGRVRLRDVAVFQTSHGGLKANDGGEVYFTRIVGHYIHKGSDSSSFMAEIYIRLYEDRDPSVETEIVSAVTIDKHWKYRIEWQDAKTFRIQDWENRSLTEGWR